jgi:serine/threonine-protein kinase
MAEVWEGHDEVLARAVAIKVLHRHLATDDSFVERFRREAIAAARLAHPNIVATFDAGTEEGDAYIVMELIRGRTLRQRLTSDRSVPPMVATAIAIQVADALGHAHSHGIVHRDVKPANILLCEDDDGTVQAKVADFGVAKAASGWGSDLTKTGTVVGTAKYLSPEQVEGREPDARSDLYAVGVLLYEMLCGQAPFVGDTELATAMAHLDSWPLPPRRLQAGIPAPLDAEVMRALARDPDDRPQTAADLRDRLAAVDFGPDDATSLIPNDPTPPGGSTVAVVRPAPRSRVPVVIGVIVVAALLAVVGLVATRPKHHASPAVAPQGPAAAKPLAITSVTAFDPAPGGDGHEHDDETPRVLDQNPATFWETETYSTSRFGGLKDGVGLVLQLSGPQAVHQLHVTTPANGWSAEVFGAAAPQANLAGWGPPIAQINAINGDGTFNLGGKQAGAVLLWISDLGPAKRVEIHEVAIS